MKDLDKAGCPLSDVARGLILLRDAMLTTREQDNVQFWTQGSFELSVVRDALRKLDRPSLGASTSIMYEGREEDAAYWRSGWEGEPWDEDWWTGWTENGEWANDYPEWGAEDEAWQEWPEGHEEEVLSEEAAQEIWAQMSYPQARKALNHHRLARGWNPNEKGEKGKGKWGYKGGKTKDQKDYKGGKKGSGQKGKEGYDRLAALIARTKCAQCGRIGHWKRECPEKKSAYFIDGGGVDGAGFNLFVSADKVNDEVIVNNDGYGKTPGRMARDEAGQFVTFVGLTMTTGAALIDTGAQTAVIGESTFHSIVADMKKHGAWHSTSTARCSTIHRERSWRHSYTHWCVELAYILE
eukprot:6469003-Amphidinium_carterae.1